MHITEPGRVTDRITLLGRPESCVELLDGGDELALLGGAMAYVVPDLLEQLERFGVDEAKLTRLFVLHSHFDHCGMIPYLKRRWPRARVTASTRAAELLTQPKISGSIALLNQAAAARYGRTAQVQSLGCEFTGIVVDEAVEDGDRIALGDLELEVLALPGHSSCSIAVYVPALKALFPSDAAGIDYGDFFLSSGNSNFDLYQQGLERLVTYDVEVLLKEHYGGHVGEEARTYLRRSIEEAKKTRALLDESYRRTGDVGRCTEAVLDELTRDAPADFLPREVLALVVGQMVRHIAKTPHR